VALVVAVALLLPILYGNRPDAAGAAWRYFLLMVVALAPLLLTAGAGGAAALPLAPLAVALLLLGGFPFFVGVGGVARTASPAALALALSVAQWAVLAFLLTLLDAVPSARASITFRTAIGWSAALTALIAVWMMGRAVDWRGLVAGATLLDVAFMLAATLAPGIDGLLIALPGLAARYLALALLTLGLSAPPPRMAAGLSLPERWWRVVRPAALWLGLLTLVGLPLTPAFASRWAQTALIGRAAGGGPAAVLTAAVALAAWIALRRAPLVSDDLPGSGPAGWGEVGLGLALLGLAALLGLLPDLLAGFVGRLLGV
jgi:hypothetical protein